MFVYLQVFLAFGIFDKCHFLPYLPFLSPILLILINIAIVFVLISIFIEFFQETFIFGLKLSSLTILTDTRKQNLTG